MDLHWLKPLLGRPSPFTTVYLDATRTDANGDAEAADRWRAVRRGPRARRRVRAACSTRSPSVVSVADRRARAARPRASSRTPTGVVVDRVLSEPPAQSHAVFGPAPALLPGRARRRRDRHVPAGRGGPQRCGPHLGAGGTVRTEGGPETETVEGGHDDVHKTREGGLDRRSQTRAEDSWERNAEAVAAVLDKRVAEREPDLVLITGDVRAVALVRDAVGQPTRELLVEVPGGSRGEGVNQASFEAQVAEALEAFRARRREAVLDRFREAQGRGGGAVTALDDVDRGAAARPGGRAGAARRRR